MRCCLSWFLDAVMSNSIAVSVGVCNSLCMGVSFSFLFSFEFFTVLSYSETNLVIVRLSNFFQNEAACFSFS